MDIQIDYLSHILKYLKKKKILLKLEFENENMRFILLLITLSL